ncbi:MAG: PTS transporter subunit EIIC [Eubacterium ramulus]
MGVFGGIIVGLGVAALHNRFYKIELPQVLSFFGGTRFVPIISGIVFVGVGILMFFVWPLIQSGIYALGDLALRSGYVAHGYMVSLSVYCFPFGLHHVFYLPFWQTGVGGTLEVGGNSSKAHRTFSLHSYPIRPWITSQYLQPDLCVR